jgi:hypothetical protein
VSTHCPGCFEQIPSGDKWCARCAYEAAGPLWWDDLERIAGYVAGTIVLVVLIGVAWRVV